MNYRIHSIALLGTVGIILFSTPYDALAKSRRRSKSKKKIEKKEVPLNVIYILADDLGYGDLGCYGQKFIKTPNIDRLAQQGVQFMQHYSGSAVSAPSRCSLLTGLNTGHAQVRGNKEIDPEGQMPMSPDTYTLGKLFKDANYQTGLFGKWGLGFPGSGSTPNEMGFEEFYGYNCQRMAHSYYPEYLWHNNKKVIIKGNENGKRSNYTQDSIHIHAMRFIQQQKGKQFFALLTYTLPHAEINAPKDALYEMYARKFPETPFVQNSSYASSETPRATYAAMVSRLDLYVGELVELLKAEGLDKNTIIMFSSDNGPHSEGGGDPEFFNSNGPFRGIKRDLYEGGIRVPMIAWCPGIIKPAKTQLISAFWDVLPTLADAINIKLPVATDGISFMPTLLSRPANYQQKHEYLYWEFHERGGRIAVRYGDWKAVKYNYGTRPDAPIELYNLSKDIHEDHNLAPEYPEIVQQLGVYMKQARTETSLFNFGRKK